MGDDGGKEKRDRTSRSGKWLTELGSWFRSQRENDGLWSDVSVNHDWLLEEGIPAVETPVFFVLAYDRAPKLLLSEAIRRLQEFLPGSDRIPVAVIPFNGPSVRSKSQYAALLLLDDLVDLATDAVIQLTPASAEVIKQHLAELEALLSSSGTSMPQIPEVDGSVDEPLWEEPEPSD